MLLLMVGAAAPAPSSPARDVMLRTIVRAAQEDYPGLTEEADFQAALAATAKLDRAAFVSAHQRAQAYLNSPLQIGYGQTISDPYIVAIMTAAVGARAGSNIFEVGTGSGYQAAVLSLIGAHVHSVEIVPQLAVAAAKRLRRLRYRHVTIKAGDGFAGWPEFAPYDGIIVTAGAAVVPPPLLAQLKSGGRLIMPIGVNTAVEQLILITKQGDGGMRRCSFGPAMFVPLTGRGLTPESNGLYDRTIPLCHKGQTARWPGQAVG